MLNNLTIPDVISLCYVQIKSNQIYFEAQNMKETKQMKNKK